MLLKCCLYLALVLSGFCFAADLDYYKMNPQKIEKALLDCTNKNSFNKNCYELKNVAQHINNLAIELQLDPQGYGLAILKMQEKLGEQMLLQNNTKANPELLAAIDKNKQEISKRLTVIKWLESPGKH